MSGTVMKDSISDRAGDGLGDGVREEEPAPQEVFRPGEGEGVGRDAVEQAQVPYRPLGTQPLALVVCPDRCLEGVLRWDLYACRGRVGRSR